MQLWLVTQVLVPSRVAIVSDTSCGLVGDILRQQIPAGGCDIALVVHSWHFT